MSQPYSAMQPCSMASRVSRADFLSAGVLPLFVEAVPTPLVLELHVAPEMELNSWVVHA